MATARLATGAPVVTLADVEAARAAIAASVVPTPLVRAPRFPGLPDAPLYLKLENLQTTGAFKLRGATNRLAHLTPTEAKRGVIAASAGNHAQGVAYAARARGIPATIVMAKTASPLKVHATRELGAEVVLFGDDYEEAFHEAKRRAAADGPTLVHPFDDPYVIAGQGTVGLEIVDALPEVERIVVGVGGGGLLAGIAVAAKGRRPSVKLVGVQPEGSETLREALATGAVVQRGPPHTFADGLATRHVGELPLALLRRYGVEARVVDDRTIARAVFLLLEKAHVLAEGAGATPLAALLADPKLAGPGPTVLVVSGGNLDPFQLDRVLFIGLSMEGRLLKLRVVLRDTPGGLVGFLKVAADAEANVRHIAHDRDAPDRMPGEVYVDVELEVRDSEHATEVLSSYQRQGYPVTRLDSPASTP